MRIDIGVLLTIALALAPIARADAQDRAAYDRRVAASFLEWFQALDRDGSGSVTRQEAQGDLNFTPRFDDMDINRDGIVTKAELDRYLELQHGARVG